MTLNIQMQGDKELVARFDRAGEKARQALAREITKQILILEGHIKNDKLSGQVLHVVSGALRASVHSVLPVEQTATMVRGRVAQSGDVKYGAIHEFGGQTPPHVIEATKANALAFIMGGKQVFFKRVNHPGSKIPERSYMRSGLADQRDAIVEGLNKAIGEAVK